MPKYLFRASYTPQGIKGVLKDGGSKRRAAVEELAKSIGAKVEAFYFAFGSDDVYLIVEAPDNVTVAAVSLAVNGSGAATVGTTVLLTPEEMDQACRRTVAYRPPGA